jgi:DNA invertase Pin-like site-specific DNA recombinase
VTTLGYARVSTDRQSLDQQHDALTAAGAERIFTDKRSGARDDREGLAALIDYAREGDVVVVVALDRLGRSLSGIIRTIETLTAAGVQLRSLREGIDSTTAMGQFLTGIFGALAQYERTLINERSAAAREAAHARGKPVGRPTALSTDQARQVRALHEAGESVPALVATFGVSRATVYRALAEDTAPRAALANS